VKIRRFYELLSLWRHLMNRDEVSLRKVKANLGVTTHPEERNRVPVLPGFSLEFYQAAPFMKFISVQESLTSLPL
jgi:hypothetical protein